MGNSQNKFINKGINKDLLSEENKKLISEIPLRDYTYICKNCNKIPKIEIIYNENEGFIEKIKFKECGKLIIVNEINIDNCFGLVPTPLNTLQINNYMNLGWIRNKNEKKI